MNVVFICDKNYLLPTKVSINSIISNKASDDILNIYVIGIEVKAQDFSGFDVFRSEKVHINMIVPEQSFQQIHIHHWYVSKAALYKMKIADILSDLDKALYIDSDILVLKSLHDLYHIDLKNNYAAVVEDMEAKKLSHMHEIIKVKQYFNSGMMLLNLSAIREGGITQKLISDREQDKTNYFMDQNTFNRVFASNVMFLLPEYNYMQTINQYSLEERADFFGATMAEMKKIEDQPTILHLTNRNKPWNSGKADNKELWFSYLFESDRETVISNIIQQETKRGDRADCLQEELNQTKIELQRTKAVFECMKEQYHADYQYRKNSGFIENAEKECSDVEKWVLANKETLIRFLHHDNSPIIIYGAGRVGRAVFKCLWKLGLSKSVIGYAVKDKDENVSELFGKVVDIPENYKEKDSLVIVAIKSYKKDLSDTEEICRNLIDIGFKNLLDVNRFFEIKFEE